MEKVKCNHEYQTLPEGKYAVCKHCEKQVRLEIKNMSRVVAIIPARAGSKRLLGKNKRDFCGKPLICWTIEQALGCDFIDEIVVSTDDLDIIEICQQYLNKQKLRVHPRPEAYAQDDTPMIDVILNVLERYEDDTHVILLQPTSPLRIKEDITYCYKHLFEMGKKTLCVVSAFREDYLHFKLNGVIYISRLDNLRVNKTFFGNFILYVMPEERSIDIDTLTDFMYAEKLMEERIRNECKE